MRPVLRNIAIPENRAFMIRTEAPYIPNHEKQVIWDTNSPSKVPQIFEIANLGYILNKNTSQIMKNKPFGIQTAPKKYQIFEITNLGYKQVLKSPKISRIPRIFAFYDTNVGKNIINASNIRVL